MIDYIFQLLGVSQTTELTIIVTTTCCLLLLSIFDSIVRFLYAPLTALLGSFGKHK